LVLNKKKSHTDILFVDASGGFEPDRRRNKLRTEHTSYIKEVFDAFKTVKDYAHRASFVEVTDGNNNYNLTAKRYVRQTPALSGKDLQPLKEKIDGLSAELEKVQKAIEKELKHFI
jgi:type I restriction enzyme M protein